MHNLTKHSLLVLLLTGTIFIAGAMESTKISDEEHQKVKNFNLEKMNKKEDEEYKQDFSQKELSNNQEYKKMTPLKVFKENSFNRIHFNSTEEYQLNYRSYADSCFTLKEHIPLPDYLEDLYESFFNAAVLKTKSELDPIQYPEKFLELRYKLHKKRIELYHLAKKYGNK